jgi:hypothetical protein
MSSLNEVNFDSALIELAKIVRESHSLAEISEGIFLRDGFGHVAFYFAGVVGKRALNSLNVHARRRLGGHSFPLGPVMSRDAPGAESLFSASPSHIPMNIGGTDILVKLIDRRFYGRDWAMSPVVNRGDIPPLVVFNSLKGGVGRTTALFVLANALSRMNKNVLMFDLDIEAPGLASLVFDGDERPRYGVVDYLVEMGLSGIEDSDLASFVGTSRLTDEFSGQGRVDLVPATGLETVKNPSHLIAKLARALLEVPSQYGESQHLASKIREMVLRISKLSSYDVILIDARAGLAEISAGPLLGLGGLNLLFATDHPHTFEAYRYLLSHLGTLPVPAKGFDWRDQIRFVQSKAAASNESRERFNDNLYEVLSETFYEKDESEQVFNFSLDDAEAPHSAWRILFSESFIDFNPVRDGDLENKAVEAVFGEFVSRVVLALDSQVGIEDEIDCRA